MCKYSSEECDLIVYGTAGHQSVDLEKGTILNNMESVIALQMVSLKCLAKWRKTHCDAYLSL
jgi:hypothetical protein